MNDWIIANLNNPSFTAADFKNIGGFNLDNTQLLSEDKYLKSDKITENPLFLNDSGQFSKDKFSEYYNKQAEKFRNFQQESILDNYEYGFWDVFQKPESRVKNPEFNIDKVSNPTHLSTGVVGINVQGERTKSDFELAERLKIYDYSLGKFLNETPEDYGLFTNPFKFVENLFSEPLVLAKYEKDTDEINPLTGVMEYHKKGDNKINNNGEYYFETLGGRSVVGKEVLSLGDILTKEDSDVNKFDFFDSDDLEKSPVGVIAKNLAAIAPMVFLGPAASSIYSGFYVGRELLKTLPMLEKVATVFTNNDIDIPLLNTLAAYGLKFTGSTSEYGKSKTFSFENFGNLISDVALLWGQLKFIANQVVKMQTGSKDLLKAAEGKALANYEKQSKYVLNQAYKGEIPIQHAVEMTGLLTLDDIPKVILSGEWRNSLIGVKSLETSMNEIRDVFAKKLRLGLDLSLIYMSMISNTDVYESAIEHGATKQEAAMVALGSMIGMFSVDKYLGLGEMFFDDEKSAQRRLYRRLLKDHYDEDVAPVIKQLANNPEIKLDTKKGLLKFFQTGKLKTIDFLKNYRIDVKDRTLGIVGKSIGEGLEEVSEELVTDLTKSLYEIGGQYGFFSQKDLGAWEGASDRYLMSFFGGAIGGGIFGGIEAIKNPKTVSDENSRDALLTLVRQEGSSKIIEELERMRDEGKLGSKELSINTQSITGEDGKSQHIFKKSDKDNISQNDFNFELMKNAIQQMDKIINGNLLNISDEKLFERMITSDMKLASLKDQLKDASYISGYYLDFLKLVNDIYTNESKIEDLENTSSDPEKRGETYDKDLLRLLEEREKLNSRKQDFLENKTLRYLKKTVFAMNTAISGLFLPVTFEQYVLKEYGKPLRFLSNNDKKEAKNKYDTWVKTKKIEDLDKAFDSFEQMIDRIAPILKEYSESDVLSWENLREKLEKNFPEFKQLDYDQRIIPLNVNLDEEFGILNVSRSDEYSKTLVSDPSKTVKAFKILLNDKPEYSFEIEQNEGLWNIDFNIDGNKGMNPQLRKRLLRALAVMIPEGSKIGLQEGKEITEEELAEIDELRNLDFLNEIHLRYAGNNKVKLRKKISPEEVSRKLSVQLPKTMEEFWNKLSGSSVELGGDDYFITTNDNTPLKVGDVIEIYTSEGSKQEDSIYEVTNINTGSNVYNFKKVGKDTKLSLNIDQVNSNLGNKYKKLLRSTYKKGILTKPGTSSKSFNGEDLNSITSPSGSKVFAKFYTGLGSEYIITEDGMTRRIKSPHNNTNGEDVGLHEWNLSSFFTEGEQGNNFNLGVGMLLEKGYTISVQVSDNVAKVLIYDGSTWRSALWSDAYPTAVSNGTITDGDMTATISKTPLLGYYLFEYNNDDSNITQSAHPGSLVVFIELNPDINEESEEEVSNEEVVEVDIPVWRKITGETDEEYENRNTKLETESPEEFNKRKEERTKKLNVQNVNSLILDVLKLIESGAIIDTNTFRFIMSSLGIRVQDIKNTWLKMIGKDTVLYDLVLDSLKGLNNDLSNVDEIWKQVLSKVVEFVDNYYSENFKNLTRIPDYEGLSYDLESKIITFLNIIDFIKDLALNEIIDLDNFNYDNTINYFVTTDLSTTEGYAALDYVNIDIFLNKSEDERNEIEGVPIYRGGYEIILEDGTVTYIEEGDVISDPQILLKIRESIDTDLNYAKDKGIGYSESLYDESLLENENIIKTSFDSIISRLKNDKRYKTLLELQKKLLVADSPMIKLLKGIAEKLGEDFGPIEETLQTIYEQFDGVEVVSDFTLSDPQIKALEKANLFLDVAKAAIIASSLEDSYANPWAYNKTINEWNREHKKELSGEVPDLLEISKDLANVSLRNILLYKMEIDVWIKRARSNGINKVKMFKEFDTKFETVKLKFFMDNKEKFITEDGVNLLEGAESKSNPKDQVLEYERALYRNSLKLIKDGKNISIIFDAFKESINWELAKTLKTSKLDLNLKELTDYDKFIYLVSCISLNPDNFYVDYKNFVDQNKDSIAPLSFLKHTIRTMKALEANPNMFNLFLDLFKKETKLDDFPILYNTVFVSGIGGAGKSSVCAKSIIGKNSWVCGPTDTQTKSLKKLSPNSTEYLTKDLLKLILKDLYDEKIGIKKELITEEKNDNEGRVYLKGKDDKKIQIESYDAHPDNIILDEATLSSNAELQVISEWCKLNNVKLFLLGDENQNGNTESGYNIARESTIVVRTPKMHLSLRDGNLWKYQNLETLMNMEDLLRDTVTSEETTAVRTRIVLTELPKFKLKYYFQDGKFSGDMITTSITDEQINTLNGSIKFIGSSSSSVYLKLKAAGKVDKAYSLKEIQGQEADYVVCDINWNLELNFETNDAFKVLDSLRKIYTVITRSRTGTIIIDNGLSSKIGGSSNLSYSTNSVLINDEAIKEFSKYELLWLNSLKLNPEEISVEVPDKELKEDDIIEDDEIEEEDEEKQEDEIKSDNGDDEEIVGEFPPLEEGDIPILVYTNFNYLGIDRDSDTKVWSNKSDLYRDIGIFLRSSDGNIETNEDKRKYSNLLFDLKSFIIYEDLDSFGEASNQLKRIFKKKNLEDVKYYIVRESYDSSIHHLISEEQGLKELPDGTEIYTLQARLKNKFGKDCIVSLGILPVPTNLHLEITRKAILREIDKLNNSKDKNSDEVKTKIERLENIKKEIDEGRFQSDYENSLSKIGTEIEIDKPDFTKVCGLSKIREQDENGNWRYIRVRLQEVNSLKSRFVARASNYVWSNIYVSMDKNDKNSGKPCIFVTGNRRLSPSQLATLYEQDLEEGNPPLIRKIMLLSAGVSFESLFDHSYIGTYKINTKNGKMYYFPFELLTTGARMYVALHNFKANITKFNDKVREKFGDDLVSLEEVLEEESRLYLEYKQNNPSGTDSSFRTWLRENESQISDKFTLLQIEDIWNFNDNDLKDVNQFRLGYNSEQGVYVRNISEGHLGNYINPLVAKLYQGTIDKIFDVIIEKIIPRSSINKNALSKLISYKTSEEEAEKENKTWASKLENEGNLVLNIVEDGETFTVKIPNEDRLKALPLVLSTMTKYILNTLILIDPDKLLAGYDDVNSGNPYTVKIGEEAIPYLKILEGGLGKIGSVDSGPGIVELKEGLKYRDRRLLNMFNVAFHGTVTTSGNDFEKKYVVVDGKRKNVARLAAEHAMFKYGFFVDPILIGDYKKSTKYRPVGTSMKYYFTNVAPSGAKTFIKIKPKSENITEEKKKKNKSEEKVDTDQSKKVIKLLTKDAKTILGIKVNTSGDIATIDDLIKSINEKISDNLYKNVFSGTANYNGRIQDFLDLIINVEYDQDKQKLKIIKLSDKSEFADLKTSNKFSEIRRDDNDNYILTYKDDSSRTIHVKYEGNNIVIEKHKIEEFSSEFNMSLKDFFEYESVKSLLLGDEFIGMSKEDYDEFIRNIDATKYKNRNQFEIALNNILNNKDTVKDLLEGSNLNDLIDNACK